MKAIKGNVSSANLGINIPKPKITVIIFSEFFHF